VTHAILNAYVHEFDVVLLQEPWTGRVGTSLGHLQTGSDVYGEPQQRTWHQFTGVPSSEETSTNSRVSAYVSKARPDFHVNHRADLISHRDILVLEFTLSPSVTFLMVNIYNDAKSNALDVLMSADLPDVPTIITGDFNLHHEAWSVEVNAPPTSPRSESLIEWMEERDFSLLNQKGEITFFRAKQTSVLDLTWANDKAVNTSLISNWSVREDLVIGSDHVPITWEILSDPSQNPPPTSRKFLFDDKRCGAWSDTFQQNMKASFPLPLLKDSTNAQLHTGCAEVERTLPSDFHKAVEAIMDSMDKASEDVLKTTVFHPKASPWFNEETILALESVRTTRKLFRNGKETTPPLDSSLLLDYLRARRYLKRTVRKAKRDWAMDFTAKVEPKNIWKLTSWYKGIRRHRSPPLLRPNGSPATRPEDKCETLSRAFFPPPPDLPGEKGTELNTPNHNTREFHGLTFDEVDLALRSTSNTSAPGASGMGYKALRWAWSLCPNEILATLQMGLFHGIHHPRWKSSVTVAIPKPNKPSYSDPKAYRPIQLLECLGKLMEKVVAKRITYDISKYEIVPFEQFGGRSSSSCIDAGLSLVHDIESSWKRGLVASVLAIDIKGFFDNVNHKRLVRIMWEYGFPLPIVRWVASFISERKASIRLDDFTSEVRPISVGVPQGSPVSPVLAVIYSAVVIRFIRDHPNLATPAGIPLSPRSYVDDYAIAAFSDSLEDNTTTLKEGLDQVVNELSKIGMTIDTKKLDIQHFSRRKSYNSSPPLVTTVYGLPVTVTAPKAMRWLGIFLDRRLSFREHVKILSAKALAVVNGIRCLGNTVRGLSQANLRILYKTCAFPILSYAAPIWFREDKRQKTLIAILDKAQNKALRLIAGAFRTTPIRALQVTSHVPPVTHLLRKLSESTAIRFSKLHPLSPVVQRLPNEWRENHRPTETTPFSTPPSAQDTNPAKHTIIQHLSVLSDPHAERLHPFTDDNAPHHVTASALGNRLMIDAIPCKPDEIAGLTRSINRRLIASKNDPQTLMVFCDGSRKGKGAGPKRSGYGVVIYHCAKPIFTLSLGLGEEAEVYDAEMFALAHAAHKVKMIMDRRTTIRRVHFYSDNTSALHTIFDPSPHPSQLCSLLFRSCVIKILRDFPDAAISLQWSPGHSGVIGNEKADRAAKRGTSQPPVAGCTYAHLKSRSKVKCQDEWREEWREKSAESASSGFAVADKRPPTVVPNAVFKTTGRELFGRLTQASTGHGYLGEYYQRFVPDETPWCFCTDEVFHPTLQTRKHIIFECDRYAQHRPLIKNRPLEVLLGTKEGVLDFLTFLRKSGAFTKTGWPRPEPPEPPEPP
jgi:ribonuclease HI